jgi:dTDP-4-dehydrorhamnose reductase
MSNLKDWDEHTIDSRIEPRFGRPEYKIASSSTGAVLGAGFEIWGGFECSIVRIEASSYDQFAVSGHYERSIADIERAAGLGIKALRYPLHWERFGATEGLEPDFSQAQPVLNRMRELGIRPIIGLLHHGSGPMHTDLLADDFAKKLGFYAGQVAAAFPWIADYTPVNEPLTTARFSGLYGFWYPHLESDWAMVRMLLNEIEGTRLAIEAVRKVNPAARLIQTEDLGHTQATPKLAYQADFENERRWLTMDLLCGRVTKSHPLYRYLIQHGAEKNLLASLVGRPCPPDVLGANYYITSERYLDENLDCYPLHSQGGNRKDMYADVETCRVAGVERIGLGNLLEQAWGRYGIRLAVTELHIGCEREEQVRWLWQHYQICTDLAKAGLVIEGLTVWALNGSYDWNSLMRENAGHYEPGVFDLRVPKRGNGELALPHPTAMASIVQFISKGKSGLFSASGIHLQPGWWERPSARTIGKEKELRIANKLAKRELMPAGRPILITGASGTLGQAVAEACRNRGLAFVLTTRTMLDITNEISIEDAIVQFDPWAIVNTAGFVRVDEAEVTGEVLNAKERCMAENGFGAGLLAKITAEAEIALVSYSSDLVFDGTKGEAYEETDQPNPLNVYGHSKVFAEKLVLERHPGALLIRTSAFFSGGDTHNFCFQVLEALAEGRSIRVLSDCYITATYVPDLCKGTIDLLMDSASGIVHLANPGTVSWYELALRVGEIAGYGNELFLIQPIPQSEMGLMALRPAYVPLGSSRFTHIRPLEEALTACIPGLVKRIRASLGVLVDV